VKKKRRKEKDPPPEKETSVTRSKTTIRQVSGICRTQFYSATEWDSRRMGNKNPDVMRVSGNLPFGTSGDVATKVSICNHYLHGINIQYAGELVKGNFRKVA
jgi:hypothetical protein